MDKQQYVTLYKNSGDQIIVWCDYSENWESSQGFAEGLECLRIYVCPSRLVPDIQGRCSEFQVGRIDLKTLDEDVEKILKEEK